MMTHQPSHFIKPPSDCRLPDHEVHIWLAELNQPPATHDEAILSLPPDEMARANRFVYAKDRRRFIVCRTALRNILANYLETNPEDIHFQYGKNGKPCLSVENAPFNIQFNIAHSDDIALLAFSRDHAIGVDIEHIRDLPDMMKMAERVFTAREHEIFCRLPSDTQSNHFFDAWVAKEAVLKATGDGLSLPMDNLELSTVSELMIGQPDWQNAFIHDRRWMIGTFFALPFYTAAFAVEDHPFQARFWQWHPQHKISRSLAFHEVNFSKPSQHPAEASREEISACAE